MSKFSLNPKKDQDTNPDQPVDLDALEAFAAGAKHRSATLQDQPPWALHDPEAKPRYNVSVRLNDYQLEMLRYVAKAQDTSQQRILRKYLLPAIERLANELFTQESEST